MAHEIVLEESWLVVEETYDIKMSRILQIFKDLLDEKPVFRKEDARVWNDVTKSERVIPAVIGMANQDGELAGLVLSPNGEVFNPLHTYPSVIRGLIQAYLQLDESTLWQWEKEVAERERRREEIAEATYKIREIERRKGYVFVYRAKATGQCQFGRTRQLKERIKSLQNSVPGGIEVVHVMYTHKMWHLHEALREHFSYRRTDNGWFLLDESDIQQIVEKRLPVHILSLIHTESQA